MKLHFLWLLLIISCTTDNAGIVERKIEVKSSIDHLSDSTFFSDIRSIFFANKIYISDYKRNQILILDDSLNFISDIGATGRGPGEFIGISHLLFSNDSIIAFNDYNRSFEFFYLNKYIGTFHLPVGMKYSSPYRFSFKNDILYFSLYNKDNSIIAYDISQSKAKFFGEVFRFESEQQDKIRNHRHVLLNNNIIISVSDNLPIVERYTTNGILIDKLHYGDISFLKKRIKYINEYSSQNNYAMLVNDAYIFNNNLFLILITNERDKVKSNTILQFSFKDQIQLDSFYRLGEGWFNCLAVKDNCLVTFNKKYGNLVKFKIYE